MSGKSLIYHINWTKEKMHMTIFIEAEEAFKKVNDHDFLNAI